jgi:hypothetical protein
MGEPIAPLLTAIWRQALAPALPHEALSVFRRPGLDCRDAQLPVRTLARRTLTPAFLRSGNAERTILHFKKLDRHPCHS